LPWSLADRANARANRRRGRCGLQVLRLAARRAGLDALQDAVQPAARDGGRDRRREPTGDQSGNRAGVGEHENRWHAGSDDLQQAA